MSKNDDIKKDDNFIQDDWTSAFCIGFWKMRDAKIIPGTGDFALQLEMNESGFSHVVNGRRNMPEEYRDRADELIRKYRQAERDRAAYIINDDGRVYGDRKLEELTNEELILEYKKLQNHNVFLRRIRADKDREIAELSQENASMAEMVFKLQHGLNEEGRANKKDPPKDPHDLPKDLSR
jgi:hypothetical protein